MITMPCMSQDAVPTLYEWAGGTVAIRRLMDAFYDRVERDDLLGPLFGGKVSEEHRAHVTVWWAEVFGGPDDYTREHGGYPAMLAHHLDLGITPELQFRFTSLMRLAADDVQLPADPEFRAAFVGYLEWGTRLAMHNSQPGAGVVTQAPVPHWGWGVAPPYRPKG
jgi:hemoglobin